MEFLKKHYEKLILSVVLLGLAAVAATLPLKVNQERQNEEARKQSLIGASAKPITPTDLATNRLVLDKVKTPIKFDIAGKHNLFNPVTWQQRPDGSFIKVQTGREVGIGALEVTSMNPLQLVVTFEGVLGNTNDLKYQITVIRETDKTPRQSRALAKGGTSPIATLKDVIGPPENPTALVVQLPGADRTEVTISKEKPYTKVIGYSADLYYGPSKWAKKGARRDDPIILGSEVYNIVATDKESVTLKAKSNQKQITVAVNSK